MSRLIGLLFSICFLFLNAEVVAQEGWEMVDGYDHDFYNITSFADIPSLSHVGFSPQISPVNGAPDRVAFTNAFFDQANVYLAFSYDNFSSQYEYRIQCRVKTVNTTLAVNLQFRHNTTSGFTGTDIGGPHFIPIVASQTPGAIRMSDPFDGLDGQHYVIIAPDPNNMPASSPVYIDDFKLERRSLGNTTTEVSFADPSLTILEGGNTQVCLNIVNPSSSQETTVDVTLSSSSSPSPHFDDFVTQELSFPANSSDQQCFNLQTDADNGEVDVNNTYTFILENLMGEGTPEIGESGTLTVTVEDGGVAECEGYAGSDHEICQGISVTLGCDSNPEEYCYKWEPEEGLDSPLSPTTNAMPSTTTTYTVHVTDHDGNYIGSDEVLVKFSSATTPSISPEEPIICGDDKIVLEVITWQSENTFEYVWSTGATEQAILVDEPGTYSVTVLDPLTNCSGTAQKVVEQSELDVAIETASTTICEGVTLELSSALNITEGGFEYLWSTSETSESIDITESGTYSLEVTNTDNGCQDEATITIISEEIEVTILPDVPIICPNGTATLRVEGTYSSVKWSNGTNDPDIEASEIEVNYSTFLSHPIWTVTVTDANGCMGSTEVEIKSADDPTAIKSYFESKGFYAIPITINEIPAAALADEQAKSTGLCDADLCDNNSCVYDDAGLSITVQGTVFSENQLQGIIEENLNYFNQEFGYTNSKAYITQNMNLCVCPDYLVKVESYFDNADLAYWIHLCKGGEGEEDQMFLLANVPTLDSHYPGDDDERKDFLTSMLNVVYEEQDPGPFATLGERVIFTAVDCCLDNYMDITPAGNQLNAGSSTICNNSLFTNPTVVAPSCTPMLLPSQVTLQFKPIETWANLWPNGALSGFTDFSEFDLTGKAFYYKARTGWSAPPPTGSPFFEGYYRTTLRGQDFGLPYASPSILDNNSTITTGTTSNVGNTHSVTLNNWFFNENYPLPTSADEIGIGNIVSDIFMSPCEIIGNSIIGPPPTMVIDLPELSEIDYSQLEYNDQYDGIFINLKQEDGSYIHFFAQQNGQNLNFYIWNCHTGDWEDYDITDSILIDNIQATILQSNNNHTDEDNDNVENLEDPVCFYLTPEQIGTFELNNIPNVTDDIKDYYGLVGQMRANIEEAIAVSASRWNVNLKFVITADIPSSIELADPLEEAGNYFNNTPMSAADGNLPGANLPDVIYWVHFNQQTGTAGICLRFADDFFTHTDTESHPVNISHVIEEVPMEEALEAKSVFIASLRDAIKASEFSLTDSGFTAEGEVMTPPAMERPWFFGLRPLDEHNPNQTLENINFFSVSKEVIGVGRQIIKEYKIPDNVWELSGNSMFDAPGLLIGCGDAIIQENALAGLAQGIAFAQSFVKEPETREAILDAVLHPGRVVRGIVQEKYENYFESESFEHMTYHAGVDGTSLIIQVLAGGLLTEILERLRTAKAKEGTEILRDQVDAFPEALDHPFFKEFENFPIEVGEEFQDFYKKIGDQHVIKFTTHHKLIRVWALYKDVDGIDIEAVFKKFPDPSNTDFYSKFDEIFFANDIDPPLIKTQTFLKDLRNNDALMNIFKSDPKAIDAWDVLNEAERPSLRKKTSGNFLINLGDLINNNDFQFSAGNFGWSKVQFTETFKKQDKWGYGNFDKPYPDEDGVDNFLGATLKADELTNIFKTIRDLDVQPSRIGDVLQDICCSGDNQFLGAEWQLRYSKDKLGNITGFEFPDNSNGVERVIDVIEFDGSITKRVELKSWSNFSPNYNFTGQFVKDLIQVNDLNDMKWVFDGKKSFLSLDGSPNIPYLRENVRNSIVQNLEAFDDVDIFEKFENFAQQNNPNVIIDDINDLADYINNSEDWFNLIFKIE